MYTIAPLGGMIAFGGETGISSLAAMMLERPALLHCKSGRIGERLRGIGDASTTDLSAFNEQAPSKVDSLSLWNTEYSLGETNAGSGMQM